MRVPGLTIGWGFFLVFLLGGGVMAQYGEPGKTAAAKSKTTSVVGWPNGARAAVSLTFDDGRVSQVDNGVPVMDRYGIRATFFVNPGALTARKEAWLKAAAKGHEIGNHTLSHPCTGNFLWARDHALEDLDLSGIEREIAAGAKGIEEVLGLVPRTFAYSCGQKYVGRGVDTRSYVPVVAKDYLAARGWRDEGINDPSYCDLAQLLGMEFDGLSFPEVKMLMDQAAESGGWLVLAGHDIGKEGRQTVRLDTLEEICRYGSDPANGIWIDTVENIARHILRKRPSNLSR